MDRTWSMIFKYRHSVELWPLMRIIWASTTVMLSSWEGQTLLGMVVDVEQRTIAVVLASEENTLAMVEDMMRDALPDEYKENLVGRLMGYYDLEGAYDFTDLHDH